VTEAFWANITRKTVRLPVQKFDTTQLDLEKLSVILYMGDNGKYVVLKSSSVSLRL